MARLVKSNGTPCPCQRRQHQLCIPQFLDLHVVRSGVFLESEVVFLLLLGREGPLFQLLLVPVHLQLEPVHFLIRAKYGILNGVELVLGLFGLHDEASGIVRVSIRGMKMKVEGGRGGGGTQQFVRVTVR